MLLKKALESPLSRVENLERIIQGGRNMCVFGLRCLRDARGGPRRARLIEPVAAIAATADGYRRHAGGHMPVPGRLDMGRDAPKGNVLILAGLQFVAHAHAAVELARLLADRARGLADPRSKVARGMRKLKQSDMSSGWAVGSRAKSTRLTAPCGKGIIWRPLFSCTRAPKTFLYKGQDDALLG
jgi:hypothetical protein